MAQRITTEAMVTIGLDLGDRQTAGCVVDEGGQILERFEARTIPRGCWRPRRSRVRAQTVEATLPGSPELVAVLGQLTTSIRALDRQLATLARRAIR